MLARSSFYQSRCEPTHRGSSSSAWLRLSPTLLRTETWIAQVRKRRHFEWRRIENPKSATQRPTAWNNKRWPTPSVWVHSRFEHPQLTSLMKLWFNMSECISVFKALCHLSSLLFSSPLLSLYILFFSYVCEVVKGAHISPRYNVCLLLPSW